MVYGEGYDAYAEGSIFDSGRVLEDAWMLADLQGDS